MSPHQMLSRSITIKWSNPKNCIVDYKSVEEVKLSLFGEKDHHMQRQSYNHDYCSAEESECSLQSH